MHITNADDIQRIVDANPAGTTYTLAAGIYSGQTIIPKDGDTFVGESDTILTGARVLEDWKRSGTHWYATGQTQQGVVSGDPAVQCRAGHPRCLYPEDLFIDDEIVTHVASVAEVGPGTWHFDYKADRIYIGDDPTGRLVETSVTPQAFRGNAADVTLLNLIIDGYACSSTEGAIQLAGPRCRIRSCEVRRCHNAGIKHADYAVIQSCHIHHNGAFGINGAGAGSVIEGNEIAYNGTAGYNPLFGAGGTKWVFTEDLVVRLNHAHHNFGPALWTDISNNNTRYEGNRVTHNEREGIFHELSYAAVIVGNYLFGNAVELRPDVGWSSGAAILICNSKNVEVCENDIVDCWQSIMFLDDANRYSNPADETHGAWGPVENLWVHHNRITTTVNVPGGGRSGAIQAQGTNDVFALNNKWDHNSYTFPDNQGEKFCWHHSNMTPDQWRGVGQDPHSTW